jgi:hypothetical protein
MLKLFGRKIVTERKSFTLIAFYRLWPLVIIHVPDVCPFVAGKFENCWR